MSDEEKTILRSNKNKPVESKKKFKLTKQQTQGAIAILLVFSLVSSILWLTPGEQSLVGTLFEYDDGAAIQLQVDQSVIEAVKDYEGDIFTIRGLSDAQLKQIDLSHITIGGYFVNLTATDIEIHDDALLITIGPSGPVPIITPEDQPEFIPDVETPADLETTPDSIIESDGTEDFMEESGESQITDYDASSEIDIDTDRAADINTNTDAETDTNIDEDTDPAEEIVYDINDLGKPNGFIVISGEAFGTGSPDYYAVVEVIYPSLTCENEGISQGDDWEISQEIKLRIENDHPIEPLSEEDLIITGEMVDIGITDFNNKDEIITFNLTGNSEGSFGVVNFLINGEKLNKGFDVETSVNIGRYGRVYQASILTESGDTQELRLFVANDAFSDEIDMSMLSFTGVMTEFNVSNFNRLDHKNISLTLSGLVGSAIGTITFEPESFISNMPGRVADVIVSKPDIRVAHWYEPMDEQTYFYIDFFNTSSLLDRGLEIVLGGVLDSLTVVEVEWTHESAYITTEGVVDEPGIATIGISGSYQTGAAFEFTPEEAIPQKAGINILEGDVELLPPAGEDELLLSTIDASLLTTSGAVGGASPGGLPQISLGQLFSGFGSIYRCIKNVYQLGSGIYELIVHWPPNVGLPSDYMIINNELNRLSNVLEANHNETMSRFDQIDFKIDQLQLNDDYNYLSSFYEEFASAHENGYADSRWKSRYLLLNSKSNNMAKKFLDALNRIIQKLDIEYVDQVTNTGSIFLTYEQLCKTNTPFKHNVHEAMVSYHNNIWDMELTKFIVVASAIYDYNLVEDLHNGNTSSNYYLTNMMFSDAINYRAKMFNTLDNHIRKQSYYQAFHAGGFMPNYHSDLSTIVLHLNDSSDKFALVDQSTAKFASGECARIGGISKSIYPADRYKRNPRSLVGTATVSKNEIFTPLDSTKHIFTSTPLFTRGILESDHIQVDPEPAPIDLPEEADLQSTIERAAAELGPLQASSVTSTYSKIINTYLDPAWKDANEAWNRAIIVTSEAPKLQPEEVNKYYLPGLDINKQLVQNAKRLLEKGITETEQGHITGKLSLQEYGYLLKMIPEVEHMIVLADSAVRDEEIVLMEIMKEVNPIYEEILFTYLKPAKGEAESAEYAAVAILKNKDKLQYGQTAKTLEEKYFYALECLNNAKKLLDEGLKRCESDLKEDHPDDYKTAMDFSVYIHGAIFASSQMIRRADEVVSYWLMWDYTEDYKDTTALATIHELTDASGKSIPSNIDRFINVLIKYAQTGGVPLSFNEVLNKYVVLDHINTNRSIKGKWFFDPAVQNDYLYFAWVPLKSDGKTHVSQDKAVDAMILAIDMNSTSTASRIVFDTAKKMYKKESTVYGTNDVMSVLMTFD